MVGVLVEGVVGATTVVGVALPIEEAGGGTTMSEGELFKIFSLACIHVPSLYYGGYFWEGGGGRGYSPYHFTNWLSYIGFIHAY